MPIRTLHRKAGTWILRKPRTYCPQCGKRLPKDDGLDLNEVPACPKCAGR